MPAQPVRKIVIFNMNHIGDVLFTTPALAALRQGYPNTDITVLVGSRAREVLEGNPHIAHLLEFPLTFRERWRLSHYLTRQGFDLSLSFSSRNIGLAAWGKVLGCTERWGFDRPETRWFFTGCVKPDEHQHWVEDYLALACAAGGKPGCILPRIHITRDEAAWAEKHRADMRMDPAQFSLGFHMGATYSEKCWRPERFVELSRLAADNRHAQIIVFGGDSDVALGDWLVARVPGAINLVGRLTLRQFAAVARHCSAFVGGDSGPAHIAAALGVPTVALFGFTDPARTGVLGERVRVLTGKRHVGRATHRSWESPFVWLDDITAEEVWKAICRQSAS